MLHFIRRSRTRRWSASTPRWRTSRWPGSVFSQAVGQALWAGKLFHIDLNSQYGPRYDQDFRFGAEELKEAFLTVRLLERSGYDGPRHFDARAYRSEDDIDVYESFARGCIRNYKILAAKVAAFDSDPELIEACREAGAEQLAVPTPGFSAEQAAQIRDEDQLSGIDVGRGRRHEQADQMMIELLLGAR